MFRKILLWTLGLLIFSLVAYVAASYWLMPTAQLRHELGRRIIDFQMNEAVHAYQTSGPRGLAELLGRLDEQFPGRHHLLDSAGRDLSTGRDQSALVREAEERPTFHLLPPKRFLIKRRSPTGGYIFLIEARVNIDPWSDLIVYGWIVVVVVLSSYALAWVLARPVRALRDTMIRFGHGELAARFASSRRDEIGDLGRSFNEMAERIETLLTAERRLLQDVSHELRSPLTRLRFALALAKSAPDPTAALAQVEKEVTRLSGLVDELLQMTRAEGDPGARNFSAVELSSLLRSIVEDGRVEAEAHECEIRLAVKDEITLQGDQELLRRGVENVLRNAIYYTAPGTAIDVACFREDSQAVVQVRDQGPGIPEEALKDVFRPFFRVGEDRNPDTGGIGLGLAIADRAVRLHHGEIQARNMNPGLLVEIRLRVE
jgi:signal transduction histidine kinase